jgi:hypothetical protein
MKNEHLKSELTVYDAYIEAMDEIMPFLSVAEQTVYNRLLRLTHAKGLASTCCKYSDLVELCGISLSTLQRALRGLRAKKLIQTVWQSHGASTFHVHLLSTLPRRPAFFPKQTKATKQAVIQIPHPPICMSFSDEDRDLFISCKRALSPQRLNAITEQAVEHLTEEYGGEPSGFSDESLRDKVDELVMKEVFGPERQARYLSLFSPPRYL